VPNRQSQNLIKKEEKPHLNIIKELNRRAVGLANPFPAISGALPWTASKIEASLPMLPEGVKPRPPIKPADKSERISPYRLGMTMTVSAKGVGSVAIYISAPIYRNKNRQEPTRRQTRSRRSSSYATSGYSLATARQAVKNMPSDIFLLVS
jgi:hypothetical protein